MDSKTAARVLVAVFAATGVARAEPHGHDTHRPDSHAPIGVMGDHTHKKGEVMLSYRYMRMNMEGNRDGTDDFSVTDVLNAYPVVPTRMDTQAHVFGIMYAPIDRVTLMLMVPYLQKQMDHINRMGTVFRTSSSGVGDISFWTLTNLYESQRQKLILDLAVSFPSGSIDQTDVTPMSAPGLARLPYPMQLGSGSYELIPGLTYTVQWPRFSLGSQILGRIRLDENDNDYTVGDQYNITGWAALVLTDWLSAAFRIDWRQWFNYDGMDPRLAPLPAGNYAAETMDPDRRAGKRLDAGFSVNLGPWKGARLGFEFLVPMYQNLDGPQLETDWSLVVGPQYAF